MQHDSVTDIKKRTERYWYEDGIWEIGFGVVNLLLGLFFLLIAPLNWAGPISLVLILLQVGAVIGAFTLMGKLVNFLKERITYRRTGFVSYRKVTSTKERLKRWIARALVAAGSAALVGLLATSRFMENRMSLAMSVIYAGVMIFSGYRFSLLRLYAMAVLIILWGYLVSAFQLPDMFSSGAFFAGTGVLVLLSGIVILLLYIRRTRPVDTNQMNLDQ